MSKIKEENSTCIICGKKYHLCIACERSKTNWQQWKVIADTENCYKIYKVLNDYNFNKISKEEARSLLGELDLKEVDSFKENVKKQIKDIMRNKKAHKITRAKEIEEIVKDEITSENTTEQNVGTVE